MSKKNYTHKNVILFYIAYFRWDYDCNIVIKWQLLLPCFFLTACAKKVKFFVDIRKYTSQDKGNT